MKASIAVAGLLGIGVVGCRTPEPAAPPRADQPGQPGPDVEIVRAIAQVSQRRQMETVQRLVSFGTRHTCAEPAPEGMGIAAAREWIRATLAANPGVQVALDPFPVPKCAAPVTAYNVVGYVPGSDAGRLVIVGGHYDSLALHGPSPDWEPQRWSGQATPAPGANDSGSQTALVLEAARVLSPYRYRATLVFIAFAGEEQGLLGSKAFATGFQRLFPNARIEAVLNCDIVGGDESVNDPVTLRQYRLYSPGAPRETGKAPDGTNDSTSPSRGLMRFVGYWGARYVPSMTALPRLREDRISRGGDHESFIAEGFPAVRLIETQENVTHQHSDQDTVAQMTPSYLQRMTEVVAASAAALARALPAPATLEAKGASDSPIRLTWSPVAAATAYVVAARPIGEPYYRKRLQVPVSQTSLQIGASDFGILTREPFFVSVAALDGDAHESLFAYPEIRCDASGCVAPPGARDITQTVK